MGYLIGSEGEQLVVPESGAVYYEPTGVMHAVDDVTIPIGHDPQLGFAVCGTPVRVWPVPLEQANQRLHDGCRERIEAKR